ncbi:DUF6583 family protein [Fictibacillus sp. Mic-4]|uniref:hypothetical protein n=1 Tax=Fictibacillus sp. Mic-4 TaxID=3132826 RepID=UPI003CE78E9A
MDTRNETAAGLEVSTNKNPGKKKIAITAIILAVILIGIGGTVYAVFFNKSPKELYFISELNSYKALEKSFNDSFGNSFELQDKMKKSPYQQDMTIGVNMNANGLEQQVPELAMVQEFLKNSKLKLGVKQDPKKEQGAYHLGFLMNDSEIANAEFFQSNDKAGVFVPELYNKYFYVENKKFGETIKKFDPSYQGPNELPNLMFAQTKTKLNSPEFWKKKGMEYALYIGSKIKDDDVKLKKDVSFKGEKLRQLTLTLSEKETKDLVGGLLNKLSKDDELINEIVDQQMMSASLENNSITPMPSKKELKEKIVKDIQDAEKQFKENASLPNGLKQVVIINDDEEIVSRNIVLDAKNEKTGKTAHFAYKSTNWTKDNDATDKTWNVEAGTGENDKLVVDVKSNTVPDGEKFKRTINGSFKVWDKTTGPTSAGIEIKTNGTQDNSKSTFKLNFTGKEAKDVPEISGTYDQKTDQNLDKNYSNSKATLGLNLAFHNDPEMGNAKIDATIDIDTKTKFVDHLKFPDLTPQSAVNVSEVSQVELMKIMQDIQTNAQKFIGKNASLFQNFQTLQ